MKLKWLLSLSILLTCCEISLQGLTHLLAKKFVGAKFFKKMKALKQCDLVWENVEHPHCETTWDRQCTPVSRTECDTEYVQKCIQEPKTKCRTDQIEQCETKNIEFCETEAVRKCVPKVERQCRTEDLEECWEEDEQDCKTKKECGTRLDKVCSTIKKWSCDKPKPEPEPEPESEPEHSSTPSKFSRGTSAFTNPIKKIMKRSADAKIVKDVEEEMMDRFEKMSMRSLLDLTDTMTEEDFEEDDDDEAKELEKKLEVRAKRSLSVVAGAIGLSALYKKFLSTQDECRQVDVPLCAEVPIETCYDVRRCQNKKVPKCHDVPTEVCEDVESEDCWTEPEQSCWTEPKEKCWQIPDEQCWDEPVEKCWKEPEENCWQVTDEECEDIPSEHCEAVNVKVARRKCGKKQAGVQQLLETVTRN